MRKKKPKWMPGAEQDLREIKARIARQAPKTAADFIKRLRSYADRRLRLLSESGGLIIEDNRLGLREIYFGNFRIIYHYDGVVVSIVAVRRGSREFYVDSLMG